MNIPLKQILFARVPNKDANYLSQNALIGIQIFKLVMGHCPGPLGGKM